MSGGGRGVVRVVVLARCLPPPHLASPLKGGRDELGKGRGMVNWGWYERWRQRWV